MYEEHLRETNDGDLETLTSCGRYTLRHIRLDRRDLRVWRQARRTAVSDIRNFESIVTKLENLALAEIDDGKKERALSEIAALKARIQTDRIRYL